MSSTSASGDGPATAAQQPQPPSTAASGSVEDVAAQERVLQELSRPDSIMEPNVSELLQQYRQAGGQVSLAINKLSEQYKGYSPMCALIESWLLSLPDMTPKTVKDEIDAFVCDWLESHFNADKLDLAITARREAVGNLRWLQPLLQDLCQEEHWRKLMYVLSDKCQTSYFLDQIIKTAAEQGFYDEVAETARVASQLDVFLAVFEHCLHECIVSDDEAQFVTHASRVGRLASHAMAGYIVSQSFVNSALERTAPETARRTALQRVADHLEAAAIQRGHFVPAYHVIMQAAKHSPEAVAKVCSVLQETRLHMSHVHQLYQLFSSMNAPVVGLLQHPHIFGQCIEAVFGVNPLNEEYRHEYNLILALGTGLPPEAVPPTTPRQNRDVAEILDALEAAQSVTQHTSLGAIGARTLYDLLHIPVVSLGVLHWLKQVMLEEAFFAGVQSKANLPPHFGLIDKIAMLHPVLRQRILALLMEIVEYNYDLDTMSQASVKELILDRILFVALNDYALPVLEKIQKVAATMDVVLLSHFTLEFMYHIEAPYTADFVRAILTLMETPGVVGAMARHVSGYKDANKNLVLRFLDDAYKTLQDQAQLDRVESLGGQVKKAITELSAMRAAKMAEREMKRPGPHSAAHAANAASGSAEGAAAAVAAAVAAATASLKPNGSAAKPGPTNTTSNAVDKRKSTDKGKTPAKKKAKATSKRKSGKSKYEEEDDDDEDDDDQDMDDD